MAFREFHSAAFPPEASHHARTLQELAMTGGSSNAAKPAVAQRDLEDFLALKRELTSLKRRYTLARERLLELVDGDTH